MSKSRLIQLCLVAGVLLLLLLPLGTYIGVNSQITQTFFLLHLISIAVAALVAIAEVVRIFRAVSTGFKLLMVVAIATLSLSLLETTLPVTFRDALIHHLAVPQWWVEAGKIFSRSWHEWSYYPMLLNVGFAGFMSLGLESWVASYHWLFALLFCVIIAQSCRHILADARAGAIAFTVSATLPIIFRLSALPIVDCGLALFSAIAFLLVLDVVINGAAEQSERTIVMAGIALGLALGTKYNALPFALAIILFLLLVLARQGSKNAFKTSAILAGVALLTYAPWLFRNYYLTNNPIYPLYSNLFEVSINRPEGLPSLKPLAQRRLIYQESPLEIALLPLRIFVQGKDDQPALFDGVLSPLLLVGLISFIAIKRKEAFIFSIGTIGLFLAISILMNPLRIRYLTPIIAPLIFLAVSTLHAWLRGSRLRQLLASAAIVIHCALFASYAYSKVQKEQLFDYLSGKIAADTYLRDRIPEYPLIEYVNQNIGSDKAIYLLFTGNRFALYKPQGFSGGHYSASILIDWIRDSLKTGTPLMQYFRSVPIDYLLADTMRSQSFVTEQLNQQERAHWSEFVRQQLTLVHEERGFTLWQINS